MVAYRRTRSRAIS